MDIMKAIQERHSVRSYTDKKIEGEVLFALQEEIKKCNEESGLNIQLITDEPEAFTGKFAHYGSFSGVRNYIAIVGKKSKNLQEIGGYYGERVVLAAQMLGLNTCWVALTYNKSKAKYTVGKGEKVVCVIAVGYGTTQGRPHKDRSVDKFFNVMGDMPDWFRDGIYSAMAAPTATHQQKFRFDLLDGNKVKAVKTGGFYSKIDLGIVKYHFEVAAGKDNFEFV